VGNNRGSQTGGQKGKIKDYSHDNLLKETSNGQKQLVREKALNLREKGKTRNSVTVSKF
jgi:hypothetical protein